MSSFLSPKICISKFLTLSSLGKMHYAPTVICEPAINRLNTYLMIVIKPDLVYHAQVIYQQHQRQDFNPVSVFSVHC